MVMNNDKKIVIEDRPMPEDKYKNVKLSDSRINMRGGFADTVFLGSLIMTATLWILIIFVIGK